MRRTFIAALLASAAIAVPVAVSPAFAADTPAKPDAEAAAKKDPDTVSAPVVETAHPVHRSVAHAGGVLNYTVTPGTLTIRNDDGAPTASMFYVAYTLDRGKDAGLRPVSFIFNGGPGSASLWLHLGAFGPMKVDTSTTGAVSPAPFRFIANPDTLLDKTDLVFIDAPTTGLSRPLGKATAKDFFGVDPDLDAFTRTIERYLSVNQRWNSPKFLIGESYGTLRAAGLAGSLENAGVQLNGIVLISTVLDSALLFDNHDQAVISTVPTYAALAWYHNRLQNRPADLTAYLQEVRDFAAGPLNAAMAKGDALPTAERDAVAARLAAYIGVSPEFVIRNNLRVGPNRFRKELLRDRRLSIGRLDGRFTGEDFDAASEAPDYDAQASAISGAYISVLNDYLFRDLGYQTDLVYRPNNYAGIGNNWSFTHTDPNQGPQLAADTSADLGDAMRRDPHLKVLSVNGLFDLATPFFGAEYDLKHMSLEPDREANISFKYYRSGHMVYVDPASSGQLHNDIAAFIDGAR